LCCNTDPKVKAGSIIPNYPKQQYVGEKKIDELILDIYPGTGEYHHYQDDGETFNYQKGMYNEYVFTINKKHVFTVKLAYKGYENIYRRFKIKYNNLSFETPFTGSKIELQLI